MVKDLISLSNTASGRTRLFLAIKQPMSQSWDEQLQDITAMCSTICKNWEDSKHCWVAVLHLSPLGFRGIYHKKWVLGSACDTTPAISH